MSEVISSGIIQLSVGGSAVKAGFEEANRSISSLGDANEKASARSVRSGLKQFGNELAAFVDARIGKSNRDAQRQGGSLYNLKNGLA